MSSSSPVGGYQRPLEFPHPIAETGSLAVRTISVSSITPAVNAAAMPRDAAKRYVRTRRDESQKCRSDRFRSMRQRASNGLIIRRSVVRSHPAPQDRRRGTASPQAASRGRRETAVLGLPPSHCSEGALAFPRRGACRDSQPPLKAGLNVSAVRRTSRSKAGQILPAPVACGSSRCAPARR
jgi:hypothetical protein